MKVLLTNELNRKTREFCMVGNDWKRKHCCLEDRVRITVIVVLLICAYALTAGAVHAASEITFSNIDKNTVLEPNKKYTVKCSLRDRDTGEVIPGKITYKSSDRKVAVISSKGVIHTKTKGTVTITASASGAKKSVKIRIGNRVKSIKLKGYHYFKVGKTMKLTATVGPDKATNKKLSWKSSDPSVAKVDQKGRVRGIIPGKAVITAKAKDGSKKEKTFTVKIFQFSKDEMNWCGHRGMRGNAPGEQTIENTSAAFRLAGEYGLWGCDCDLWETKHSKDGQFEIVVNHDASFRRVQGVDKKVKDMTAEDIRKDKRLSSVCFLDEYLAICAEYGMKPLVELKDPDMSKKGIQKTIDLFAETVEWNDPEDAYFFSAHPEELKIARDYCREKYGFEPLTMYEIYKLNPTTKEWLDDMDRFVREGLAGICINKELMNDSIDQYCRSHGLRIVLFTYQDILADNDQAYRQIRKYKYNIDVIIMEHILY